MNDVIYETVVTTVSAAGVPHVAPMGVRYRGAQVVLMPFRPSTTLDNIVATESAVLNIVVDTRVFAGSVTGRKAWPTVAAERIAGVRLAVALSHVELRLAGAVPDVERPVLHLDRVHEARHAPFIGFNRAQAAVIEGAVLVSRLHMLPAEKIDREMAYLQIAIDKTASAAEHEAWGWLQQAVAAHRAGERGMTRLLVSVRSVEEALAAVDGGADFIDLKEPLAGALGGLPLPTVREVIAALRERGIGLPVSATIGDWPMGELARILERVDEVAACGVDYVKVGIERAPGAAQVLAALSTCGHAVIPVLIADRGIDGALVAQACAGGFPGLMLDTADKQAGSLFDCVERSALVDFVDTVRSPDRLAGLAGALRLHHLPAIAELAPDFAGFRSAVCAGERGGALDPQRVRAVAEALRR